MALILVLFYNLFTTSLHAEPLSVEKLSVSFSQYLPGGNEPLLGLYGLENRRLDQRLALTLNTDIYDYFFWRNEVCSITDKGLDGRGQHRLLSYTYSLGVRPLNNLELSYEHNSKHILDGKLAGRFPLSDAVKLEWTLIGDKRKAGLFY